MHPAVHGIKLSAPVKTAVVQDLALAFENSALRILDDNVLKGELLSYTATKTESGYTKYNAASGEHDDTVMALAMAWQAVGKDLPAPVPGHDPFASLTGTHGRGNHIEIITDPETGKTTFGVPKKVKTFLSFMEGKK